MLADAIERNRGYHAAARESQARLHRGTAPERWGAKRQDGRADGPWILPDSVDWDSYTATVRKETEAHNRRLQAARKRFGMREG
jgi:hypothetical protein